MDLTGALIFLLLAGAAPALAAVREFQLVNLLKSWSNAQSYCREKFIDLASVESEDDWTRARALVANSGQSDAWMGVYDDVSSWRWSLDNTSFAERDTRSWLVFNEDNEAGGELCGTLFNAALADKPCDILRKSVCYDEPSDSYILDSTKRVWKDAQSYCRNAYTDLASVRTQPEWHAVRNYIDTIGGWVGLYRDGWKWSDGSESSWRGWAAAEPSGGVSTCGAAATGGMKAFPCDDQRAFICSAPQRKVLKVMLRTDASLNLNDPLVQEAALKQMEEELRGHGVDEEVSLRWREQPHGLVFNHTLL